MLVTDNVSGTYRSRMAVKFIACPVFIIDNYIVRLVLKHRTLVFKLDFKLDLIQAGGTQLYAFAGQLHTTYTS